MSYVKLSALLWLVLLRHHFCFNFFCALRFFGLLSFVSAFSNSLFFPFCLFPVYTFLKNFHVCLVFCIQMNQNLFDSLECLGPSLRL